jgi:hypothetical protein
LNEQAALKRRWTSGRERGRGQPAEETPGQAAAVVQDDFRPAPVCPIVWIWNHSNHAKGVT